MGRCFSTFMDLFRRYSLDPFRRYWPDLFRRYSWITIARNGTSRRRQFAGIDHALVFVKQFLAQSGVEGGQWRSPYLVWKLPTSIALIFIHPKHVNLTNWIVFIYPKFPDWRHALRPPQPNILNGAESLHHRLFTA